MKWFGTIIPVILGILFLFAGGTKLAGQAMHVESFTDWGYPIWFMYVTGFIETMCAVMLLVSKTRFYGAVLITCTMLGAIATLVMSNQMAQVPIPALLFVLAIITAKKHRPDTGGAIEADPIDISRKAH
ncbi:uncharacterized protein METZ01_LOCUS152523 [marine metagenome]|uniref:DoxX family protein n=1 Tax=marine metagenome TaxID=408172 RepID=A0A382AE34_9ZZZZ